MRLFKAFGTQVTLDRSWFMFVGIFTVLNYFSGGPVAAIGTLLLLLILFASVTAHEFAHIAAGRTVGIRVPKVVLHMFGGAALFPVIPFGWAETWIAVAGPLFSLAVGLPLYYVVPYYVFPYSEDLSKFIHLIGMINTMLGLFNLFPIFPMDGGRIVRGLLFAYSKKPVWSTKVVVYGSWVAAPLAVYFISGGPWTVVVLGLILLMGYAELQRVQKSHNS